MSEAADIAVVSFDKFINGGDAEKRAVAKELYNAFSTVGWVYLKDHGIPQERVEEIFDLVSHSQRHSLYSMTNTQDRQKPSSTCPFKRSVHGV
jgi:isopenicillin N synthase-like dioxygenase